MAFDYDETFDRNVGTFSKKDIETIRSSRIGIAGLGGVGGNYVMALARMGFEKFTLLDGDTFEPSNSNRQAGATVHTMGRAKVEVMKELAQEINPNIDVRARVARLGPETEEFFFDGIDFAINGIDYLSARAYALLHDGATRRGIYSLTVSPFGFGASMTMFGPGAPTFSECVGLEPGDDDIMTMLRFWQAVTPARLPTAYMSTDGLALGGPKEKVRFSSNSATMYLAAGMAAAEVAFTLLKKRAPILAPNVLQIDLLTRAFAVTPVDAAGAMRR